jgi:uncharacterized Zn-binding protein involved in type VI secretion
MGDRFKRTRVGDAGDHGGSVITGAGTHILNNRKQSRKGDIYNCPEHGPNKIIAKVTTTGDTTDYISEKQKVSHVITITECGAKIITGSEDGGADQ